MSNAPLTRKQYHALRKYIKALANLDSGDETGKWKNKLSVHEQELLTAFDQSTSDQHNQHNQHNQQQAT